MLLIGNGRLITRSKTNPYLENGAVVTDGVLVKETGTLDELRAKYPQAEFPARRAGKPNRNAEYRHQRAVFAV